MAELEEQLKEKALKVHMLTSELTSKLTSESPESCRKKVFSNAYSILVKLIKLMMPQNNILALFNAGNEVSSAGSEVRRLVA